MNECTSMKLRYVFGFWPTAERKVKRIHENELVEVPKFVEGLRNNRYCETKGSLSYVNIWNIVLHST